MTKDEEQGYRGGSWGSAAVIARAAIRFRFIPGYRYGGLGFRLVHDNDDSSIRVDRGGSWYFSAQAARVAVRYRNDPAKRFDGLGFRLAKEST